MKEKDSIHWKPGPLKDFSPGNNVSGFTALPGGFRLDSGLQGTTHLIMRYGMYIGIGNYGNWWSSTSVNTNNAKEIGLSSMFTHVYNETWQKTMGLSVRCLNDNDTYVGAKITDELEIYPNPVHEKLFIKNTISTNPFVYIFNLQGEQILFKQNATNTINISNLEKGFYVIKILDFGKVKTAIFLKE